MASTSPTATMAGMDMSSMATATPLSNSSTATLTTLERFAALNATPSPTEAMAGMDMSDVATIAPLPINGDAARGKVLFRQGIGKPEVPACVTCHYDDQDEVKVGPALSDIATHGPLHAAELGQDVVTFLRHSITTPNENLMTDPVHVFAVNGVSLMYQNYAKELTAEQIDDLVAYLLILK